jgi:hypothetical protein
MPLKSGSSKKTISKNIGEMRKNPSTKTKKAARTYAKKHGVSVKEALGKIASAAAYNKAGKSKRDNRGVRKH